MRQHGAERRLDLQELRSVLRTVHSASIATPGIDFLRNSLMAQFEDAAARYTI
jgi:hypothetical protein